MPTGTEDEPSGLLDDVAEECDRLAEYLAQDAEPDAGPEDAERAERYARTLQALSFYRLAIAVENLGAEATEDLMQATVEEAARRGMVPASSKLPKKHAGG